VKLLLALALLSTVERSADGDRIRLAFDAPVTFTQTLTSTPPRITLDVATAQVPAAMAERAHEAGFTVGPGDAPGITRFGLPLPAGVSATVSSSGSEILLTLVESPLLLSASPVEGTAQGGIPSAEDPAAGGPAGADYVIGPEDQVELNVFELPELKTTTRVLGDGTISLPLLGVVKVAGLTAPALEGRLRDLLEARFLLNPQVTVEVTEHRSSQISVVGAVAKPGTYQMIGPRTVMQMISEAGGLSKEYGPDIVILRKVGTGTERFELDLDELITRGNPEVNIAVKPGDIINVPIDRPVYVYVDGAVKNPGQIEGKLSRPVTLLQAVARAGGLTERANLRGVHVLRKKADGTQQRIPVDLKDIRKGKADDPVLEEGDVVVIPETFF
jgi:polysaccharide biosynthesis/export protein